METFKTLTADYANTYYTHTHIAHVYFYIKPNMLASWYNTRAGIFLRSTFESLRSVTLILLLSFSEFSGGPFAFYYAAGEALSTEREGTLRRTMQY